MEFDLLGEIMADKSEKVAKDVDHQFLGIRKITNEDNALHGGQRFKEVEVLVVVWRVRTPEARGELAEEELKDVAELIVCVRSVRSEQSEDIGQTASREGFDPSILVKENSVMDQLLAGRREGTCIDAVLVQLRKLSVETLQLLEQSICREALSSELIVKLELLRRGLATSTSLSYHDTVEKVQLARKDSALTETRLALCALVSRLHNKLQLSEHPFHTNSTILSFPTTLRS